MLPRLLFSIAAAACLPLACAQTNPVQLETFTLRPEVIQSRLESIRTSMPERRATLETLFREAGCKANHLTEEPIRHVKDPNIVCALPGETSSVIIVGGHYDFASQGDGAVDDWSGSVLLPSLFQGLNSKPRHHTFVFIAFAGEEAGLLGSSSYVKQFSKDELKAIHAMVNLECLGMQPPKVWASRADKSLLDLYLNMATSMKIPRAASNVDRIGDDDSHPFLNARVPVITIHSITQDTLPVLHTPGDKLKAIHPDEYYTSYRLILNYLALLDQYVE